MTITDALAELTLLEKRINSAKADLDNNALITFIEVGQVPTSYSSREDYQTKARAALQRVDALINRRRVIKRAIVLSNAAVTVTVANEEMTVAEAIEMKNFIAYYEEVLYTMHGAHKETLAKYERAKTEVKERLDKLALEVLGKNINVSDNRYQW